MSTPTPIQTAETEVSKAKVWYASHQFYAGLIAGAILGALLIHLLKL